MCTSRSSSFSNATSAVVPEAANWVEDGHADRRSAERHQLDQFRREDCNLRVLARWRRIAPDPALASSLRVGTSPAVSVAGVMGPPSEQRQRSAFNEPKPAAKRRVLNLNTPEKGMGTDSDHHKRENIEVLGPVVYTRRDHARREESLRDPRCL